MWRPTSRRTRPTDFGTAEFRSAPSRPSSRPRREVAAPPTFPRGVAAAQAGPDALARNVLVLPDEPVPAPWLAAERIRITPATLAAPTEACARLRRAAIDRERLVIELETDFEQLPAVATSEAPFELGPRFGFELDELHHLVWSNTVDVRDPDRPTWIGLDLAVAAGAAAVPAGSPGDVVSPDGTTVWIDAGPFRHTEPIDGVAVVHVVAIEQRSFARPGPNRSDADLAPDQLAAVTHPGGAARIIAPAGSGKTRVLTERARHLLRQWNVPTGALSLVAFNKRAQEEMRERTPDLPGLQVRTLNSIALAIVNGTAPFAPQARTWRTIDEPEVRRIIGDLVSFPKKRNSDPVAPWIEALSLIRLGLVDPDQAEQQYDGDVDGLAAVWPAYRARLERQGVVDFDDQIYRALLVLLTQPEARHAAQRACRIMLVDEFQDLTPAHLLLVRLLSAPGGAVFGVGDDDQTIYGYNGADPAWLIDFATLFPGAGEHPLEVNYRCPAGTVEVVDRLLRHNRRRVNKTIRAASTDPGGWSIDRGVDPVSASRAAVERALADGARPGDIAVLARVNASLAPIQVALASAHVPIAGGVGLEFADRTAVRSVLAWLRLAAGGARGCVRLRHRRRARSPAAAVAVVPSPDQRLDRRTEIGRRPAPLGDAAQQRTRQRPGHRVRVRHPGVAEDGRRRRGQLRRDHPPDRRDRPGRLGRHARRPSPRDEPRRAGRRPHGRPAARGAARRRRDVRVVAAIAARRTNAPPTACCCRPSIG